MSSTDHPEDNPGSISQVRQVIVRGQTTKSTPTHSTDTRGAPGHGQNHTTQRDTEHLGKINECFLGLGKDPNENINRLTAICGELLGGRWALYSFLDGDLLHSIGRWQTPNDLNPINCVTGYICSDVIARGGDETFVIQNLPQTAFADNPILKRYQLQTYVGQPVKRDGRYIGSLCVVFQRDFVPTHADRRLLGIVASAIGVEEERKKSEQALRQAHDEIELILASLPHAVLIINEGLRVVWTNPLAHQYFGQGQETLLGNSLFEIFPSDQARSIQSLNKTIATPAEARDLNQDREFELATRTYRYRCFTLAMRGSERPQIGLIVQDVTEDKQVQDQLVQTEKLAGLGRMVSGMAHEINNPAQAILGMAELITQEDTSPQVKEFATDIVSYARHIGAIVRDFTSYSRPSSREGASNLDLNERITEALKMVLRGPHFGQVEVVKDLQPLQALRARRAEIDQVFVNLTGNAVHAMHGHGRLTLRTWQQGMRIFASITDTGCGIPNIALNKIFEPFFTTKDPGKGTGLGLSIVNKIVKKYDGNITVNSEQGRGTTFTIEFPTETKAQGGL